MSYLRGAGLSKHDPNLGVYIFNSYLQCPMLEFYFSLGGAGSRESQMSFLIWYVLNLVCLKCGLRDMQRKWKNNCQHTDACLLGANKADF